MLATVLAYALVLASLEHDSCKGQIPKGLVKLLMKTYPDFQLPRQVDNLEEDIASSLLNGGTGCLGVARGDFNGDSREDLALLMTSKVSKLTTVLVAFSRGDSWRFSTLEADLEGRLRLYVDKLEAGHYRSMYFGEGASKEEGEVEEFASSHQGVIFGTTEASGVAYFFTGQTWVHLWLSD